MSNNPKTYLVNSFSLNMLRLDGNGPVVLRVRVLPPDEARQKIGYEKKMGRLVSAVGHTNIAAVLSDHLGTYVPPNRATVRLKPYDQVIVAQYVGPRLPEDATKLPEGSEIKFFLVEV